MFQVHLILHNLHKFLVYHNANSVYFNLRAQSTQLPKLVTGARGWSCYKFLRGIDRVTDRC